jgi:hypothetical protein
MIENRSFHLGDILTVVIDRLLSPRGMDGVYDILNYMTEDTLYTHQLPRAARECKPHILSQHPELEEIDGSVVNGKNAEYIDPAEEAEGMVGPDKVIKLDADKPKEGGGKRIDPRLN